MSTRSGLREQIYKYNQIFVPAHETTHESSKQPQEMNRNGSFELQYVCLIASPTQAALARTWVAALDLKVSLEELNRSGKTASPYDDKP